MMGGVIDGGIAALHAQSTDLAAKVKGAIDDTLQYLADTTLGRHIQVLMPYSDRLRVELGKQFTCAMLGRPDAEQARQEWNLLPKPDAPYLV